MNLYLSLWLTLTIGKDTKCLYMNQAKSIQQDTSDILIKCDYLITFTRKLKSPRCVTSQVSEQSDFLRYMAALISALHSLCI